jgi:hypothetical protein
MLRVIQCLFAAAVLAASTAGYAQDKCGMVPEAMRARCEQHNRAMDISSPCSGKTGADLEQCVRMRGAMSGGAR